MRKQLSQSSLGHNLAVLCMSLGVGFLAIHGGRMILYVGVFGNSASLGNLGPLDGTYVVAWVPPFGASLLTGALLYWALRVSAPMRWATAWGVALGAIWLAGATHTFHPTPGRPEPTFWDYFGVYSWYLMPVLGALAGTHLARRISERGSRARDP